MSAREAAPLEMVRKEISDGTFTPCFFFFPFVVQSIAQRSEIDPLGWPKIL